MDESGMDTRQPIRSTRGKRLRSLLDDELEADEEFWTQDALKEDEQDNEYEEEKEVEDVFDSDFEDDESDSDNEENADEVKVPRRKRKQLSRMASSLKQKKSSAVEQKPHNHLEQAAAAAGEQSVHSESEGRSSDEEDEKAETKRSKWRESSHAELIDSPERRKSSRTAVMVKSLERENLKAQQTPKVVKKKRAADDDRKLTQEEMLLEAAQTEILNRQSLEEMLAREEEVKKRAIIQKEIFAGPKIRFLSKNGINTMEFTLVSSVPSEINAKEIPYPKKSVCVVTGLPAKYKDPLTGQPYATVQAFKTIREKYRQSRGFARGQQPTF